MDFDRVADYLEATEMPGPKTGRNKGRKLYDAVLSTGTNDILELGFAHGVSTCYLAAALDERGQGHIVTIDKESSRSREPSVTQNLDALGLSSYVTPVWAHRSFTWELARLIADGRGARFDFVFHDGGHSWDVAGYGFFLADVLLRPGGWMLFDDLPFTHDGDKMSQFQFVKQMSAEERSAEQVQMVFDLLVRQHPDYVDCETDLKGRWGWARKAR